MFCSYTEQVCFVHRPEHQTRTSLFCTYTTIFCFVRRPNVCPFQDVETRLVQVPCRQAFTRIAKVWKPDCGKSGHWCIGHERRYTTGRGVHRESSQHPLSLTCTWFKTRILEIDVQMFISW